MNLLPFEEKLNQCIAKMGEKDTLRGNYQESVGFCSGHSFQPRTKDNIIRHFGAAVPSLRQGTKEDLFLIRTLSKLAAVMGMRVACDDFLAGHSDLRDELDFIHSEIGEGTCHALVTWTVLPLDCRSCVKRHQDKHNGHKLTEVLVASQVLKDANGE